MSRPAAAARRRAWRRGLWAESLCALSLRLRGYRIVARRHRNPAGEIDIVARRGRVLAVVEVKARGDLASAAESLSRRQRRRIARAAEALCGSRPDLAGLDLRFDVMLARPGRWPVHLRGAWRPDALDDRLRRSAQTIAWGNPMTMTGRRPIPLPKGGRGP